MTRRPSFCGGRFVPALLLFTLGVHPGGAVQAQEAEVFIQVLDADGWPVIDLSAEDFAVTQGGVERRVLRVELINEPLRLAFLVDDADGAVAYFQYLREGLPAFVDALPDTSQVALILLSRQPRVVVDFSEGLAKVKDSLEEFFTWRDSAAAFFDGLRETVTRFDDDVRWPVIAVVTTDGPSLRVAFTAGHYEAFLDQLGDRGVTVHALGLSLPQGDGWQTDMARRVTQGTGGWYDTVGGPSRTVIAKLTEMAAEISRRHAAVANQYLVVYELPPGVDPKTPVSAGVRRDQVTLRTSRDGRLLPITLGGSNESVFAAAAEGGSREDLFNAGEVAFASGDIDVAAGWYDKAHQADPTWGKPLFKLALVALNTGDIETAVKYFEQVIEVDPGSDEGAQAKALITQLTK